MVEVTRNRSRQTSDLVDVYWMPLKVLRKIAGSDSTQVEH